MRALARRLPSFCLLLLVADCAKEDYVRLYRTEPKAPGLQAQDIEALKHLGPTVVERGTNFGVYSERATRIELMLFDDPESERPTRQFPMQRFGDVWNLYVEGVGVGQHYGFIAWGPNWTYDEAWYPGSIIGFIADVGPEGDRFNPNKLLLDPYAKGVHRDHDWGKGSVASGPKRTEVTYAASAKSVIVRSKYAWGEQEKRWRQSRQDENWVGHRWSDLIVYEVHPKGFTASPASGVSHPGTYRGLAEKADYFKELGITAVELLPIHEKPLDGGYWGYQTLSFFAPEVSYAARKEREQVIDEFKLMVEELHKRGIEVIIDVVYNHTGEGGLWRDKRDESPDKTIGEQLSNLDPKEVAGLYSYRGLDNQAYYALNPDKQTYWNNTGVGNQTRPNHRPMRRLILDSLRWYVEELHVDGFRFDLAPILGEKDGDYNNWDDPKNTVLQDILEDEVLSRYNTRVIAEAWSAGGWYGVKVSAFPSALGRPGVGWYEWNGGFRDWWRGFVNFDDRRLNAEDWNMNNGFGEDFGFFLTGSHGYYNWNNRRPYHSVNFVTVHDGFTMYDLFSFNHKLNKCGPLNPLCCEQPMNSLCDIASGEDNNRSRDWGGANEPMKRQQMRNLFTAMLIAHGTPMIYGGDEWMRTQYGNNNAYSTRADNSFNWFAWGEWQASDERHRMFDFVRQAIRLRQENKHAFAPDAYGKGAPFSWKSAQNTEPPDWGSRHLMVHYFDRTRGPELAILVNMEGHSVDFQLPAGRTWRRLLDTQAYFDTDAYLGSKAGLDKRASHNASLDAPTPVGTASYGVPTRSIVVLRAD